MESGIVDEPLLDKIVSKGECSDAYTKSDARKIISQLQAEASCAGEAQDIFMLLGASDMLRKLIQGITDEQFDICMQANLMQID